MLLSQTLERDLHSRFVLREQHERRVLARMMVQIGEMPQVAYDVHHEIVVRLLRFVESVDLSFQDVEEPREIGVLGVPVGDGVAHGIPRSAPPESRRTAVRGLIQIKGSGCGFP